MDYTDAGGFDFQELLDLRSGEVGDSDDEIASPGCVAGLGGEAGLKFGRGIIAGHDEEVVEGGDGSVGFGVNTLIEGVEDIGGGCSEE